MQKTSLNALNATMAASEASLQTQIAAVRESLGAQRKRSLDLWHACAPGAKNVDEGRAKLGRFTEKLLKGQVNEFCD